MGLIHTAAHCSLYVIVALADPRLVEYHSAASDSN